jgi:segregation and condensation protein B
MQDSEIRKIIEALLFASPEPLTQAKVNGIFNPDTPNLKEVVLKLNEQYVHNDHAFEINQVAGGFQLVSRQEYEHYIRKMLSKSGRLSLSSAALDSLAIIAYKQPIGRYEVEAIRGVDSSGVLKTLLNRNLIKIKGRDSGPGRPLLYQTTDKFLEHFGLNRLSDMPKLKEITSVTIRILISLDLKSL